MKVPPSIRWQEGRLWLLDQRRLPAELVYVERTDAAEVAQAIACMQVRGAPAIGVAAAYGMALAARAGDDLEAAAATLTAARPTASNLAWAVRRVRAAGDPVAEAEAIHREDAAMCHAIGGHGLGLLRDGMGVLTHCNAGALATGAAWRGAGASSSARSSPPESPPLLSITTPLEATGARAGAGWGASSSARYSTSFPNLFNQWRKPRS